MSRYRQDWNFGPRQEEARAIESKRHAIDFIKKACPGLPRDR